MNDILNTGTTPLGVSVSRKVLAKRPLTLFLAILFFLAAILPVVLIMQPVEITDVAVQSADSAAEEKTTLTISDKMETFASTIEKACYSDGTDSMKELFLIGTWIIAVSLIVSSLIFGTALLLMFLSVKIAPIYRTCLLATGTLVALTGILVLISMHIYSSVIIIQKRNEQIDIIAKTLMHTDKDAATKKIDELNTEYLTYFIRNLLVSAALLFYACMLPFFTFYSRNANPKLTKLHKRASHYKSSVVAVALVCCFFASTIALTWTFDYFAKTLLWILLMTAAVSFATAAFLHEYQKNIKAEKEIIMQKMQTGEQISVA